MQQAPASALKRVMDHINASRFTGRLRVRAREAEGELWFMAGGLEGSRFGVSKGDEALVRMQQASEAVYEAEPLLPSLTGDFTKRVPLTGTFAQIPPVALMRFCERCAVTCTLELRGTERTLRLAYQTGELMSVDADKGGNEVLAGMLESQEGSYAFTLPPFDLPAGVPRPSTPPTGLSLAERVDMRLREEASTGGPPGIAETSAAVAQALAREQEVARLRAEREAAEAKRKAEQEAAEAKRKAEEAEAKRRAEQAEARAKAEREAAEAKRKADEAEAKRRAEQAAAEARAKAEREAAEAKRKAEREAEARRKAEADAAEAKRKAEAEAAEAKRKAEAEAAEAKRKADEAEATRKAEAEAAEAKRKAEAEAAEAKRKADEAKRQADQAESSAKKGERKSERAERQSERAERRRDDKLEKESESIREATPKKSSSGWLWLFVLLVGIALAYFVLTQR